MYLAQNDSIYPQDHEKIMFVLSLMTENLPGEWMKGWMMKCMTHNFNYGTWQAFKDELHDRFHDPNLVRNQYNELQNITWNQATEKMADFIQRFEICAGFAEYLDNDKELIHLLEKKIPEYYIKQMYHNGAVPPTVYAIYRDRLLTFYTNELMFRSLQKTPTSTDGTPHSTSKSSVPKKTSHSSKKKEPTSTGKKPFFFRRPKITAQQQVLDLSTKKPEGLCFKCNKPGHWQGDCPDTKKRVNQMRSLFAELKEGELEELETALEQDFPQGL
jgi:hypothetical protein